MRDFSTKNWIIGIVIAAWITSFFVGSIHVAQILPEPENPIIHTTQDWLIILVFLLPISYVLARIIPNKLATEKKL